MTHEKRPYKSKSENLFTKKQKSDQIEQSTSEASLVKRKEDNAHPDRSYVYKEAGLGPELSEIEAFNGLCYRMLLGEQAAKVRAVHNDSNVTIGVISKLIPQYLSFHSFYRQNNKTGLTTEEFIKLKFPQILVAAYCEEENDLNAENFGFGRNKDDEIISVKIDHGASTYPVIAEKRDYSAQNQFIITADDIINFPRLKNASPDSFVHIYPPKLLDVDKLVHNPEFISQKYYSFLKRILIDDDNYIGIANATINSDTLRKDLIAHKIERTALLKNTLIAIPEFRHYINQNPFVIEQIIREFEDYNDEIRKPEDRFLKIDTQKVYSRFLDIAQICKDMEPPEILSEETLIDLPDLSRDLAEIEEGINNLEQMIAREEFVDLPDLSRDLDEIEKGINSLEQIKIISPPPATALPNKLKVRSNIIKIPASEREENIFAVNAVLHDDDLMKGQDGNIPAIILEIRNIMKDIDYSDDKKIAAAIIQIKDRINNSKERNHSTNTQEIINVFSQPGHINFRVIRDALSKNESMEKIMAPIKVDMRLD
ncbi:ankyrin repeat protein [Legionella quinlivanii]|uniref:Ankyrin repeat protein n=1 Tax=Legionella quinlivanii TaxID=45073 RepID=A0A0W0Y5V1_9GAMM|nr:hypothetical protein [Legionella quinlivanii]KTD52022.1 ankyrin repeat protein [Legionella quinlivanii]SEF87852.1 hypothetical protein SAMN02746093_01328 [Legionella quinlivanii DSM 21216]STY12483.1 ankyrin repeat protein [Legionella quinlivanii]